LSEGVIGGFHERITTKRLIIPRPGHTEALIVESFHRLLGSIAYAANKVVTTRQLKADH